MKKFLLLTSFITLFLLASMGSAMATIYDGTIYWLGGNAIGNPLNSNTLSSVDHIYFTVNQAMNIEIDLLSSEYNGDTRLPQDVNGDGEIAYIDTYIYLFNDDGYLGTDDMIASNDDSWDPLALDDGTIYAHDSFWSDSLSAGNYILAVGAYYMTVDGAVAGTNDRSYGPYTLVSNEYGDYNFVVHDHGDYRVTFTGDVTVQGSEPIPEPATMLLLGSGLIGLAGVGRKKFRK